MLRFCLTDIEGSTAMWDAQPGEMVRALVIHDQIVAAAVESSGGRFLKGCHVLSSASEMGYQRHEGFAAKLEGRSPAIGC